jgi:endonuclease YncB( thermonuclease family)
MGRVVAVADGDTITLLDADRKQHKIRLSAIDAPELRQASGIRSRQHLSGLVLHQPVKIIGDKRDPDGRLVGKVLTSARCLVRPCPLSYDVSLAQVASGMAWHYEQYEGEQSAQDRRRYAAAEDDARARGIGLWSDAKPRPPWEWRRHRNAPVAARR